MRIGTLLGTSLLAFVLMTGSASGLNQLPGTAGCASGEGGPSLPGRLDLVAREPADRGGRDLRELGVDGVGEEIVLVRR